MNYLIVCLKGMILHSSNFFYITVLIWYTSVLIVQIYVQFKQIHLISQVFWKGKLQYRPPLDLIRLIRLQNNVQREINIWR